ncbi:MAG: autotransporter-associated beta strand repeat-containing protein [Verrucomicrobiota bacterium]
MKPPRFSRASSFALAIASLLAAGVGQATTLYWDGNSTTTGAGTTPTGTWGTSAYWSTDSAGTAATAAYTANSDVVFFAGSDSTGAVITLTSTVNAASLKFEEGDTTIKGTSGIITTGGNVTVNSGASAVIGSTTTTKIAGVAGLTKLGLGTLTLNGTATNTFTGGLNLNSGTLVLDFANIAASTSLITNTNVLTLSGGALTIKGKASAVTAQTLGNVTVNAGGGQILINPSTSTSTTLTLGTLTTNAGGSFLLGRNATSGTATITTTTNKDATDIYGGRTVYFNGTANTGYDWATSSGSSGTYTLSGLPSVSYTALLTSGGVSTTNCKSGGATLIASETINSLKLEIPTSDLVLGGNTLTIASGGLLMTGTTARSITGTAATGLKGSASDGLIVQQYNSGGLTISAVIGDNTGATALTKAGTGQLTLTGANTYTGITYINAGVLQLGNGGATGSLNSGSNVSIAASGTLAFNRNGPLTQSADFGAISGAGGITQVGTGTTILSAINTYTGSTAITSGVLKFATQTSLYNNVSSNWNATNISVGNGATALFNVGGTGEFTLSDINTLKGLGSATGGFISGSILGLDTTNTTNFIIDTAIANTNSGSNKLALTKYGTHTLTLAAANTYFGDTRIIDGTLALSSVNALSNSTLDMAGGDGGSVSYATSDGTTYNIGGLKGSRPLSAGGNTLSIGSNNISTAYSGNLTNGSEGTGALTKVGSGILTLSGDNTYNGATRITSGMVQFSYSKSLYHGTDLSWTDTNTNIIVTSGATAAFNVDDADGTTRFSAANLGVILGLGTDTGGFKSGSFIGLDTTNANAGNFTYNTKIANTNGDANVLGLTKLGTGILTLGGANSYTGNTSVESGTLRLTYGTDEVGYSAIGTGSVVVADVATLDLSNSISITDKSMTFVGLGVSGSFGALRNFSGDNIIDGTATISIGNGATTTTEFNAYAGSLTISGGNGANITVKSGVNVAQTLQLNGIATGTISRVIANGTSNGTSVLLGVTKADSGTWTFTEANTYTGPTQVKNGTLILSGGDDRISSTGSVVLGDTSTSGKLILGNSSAAINQTLAGLTSTGNAGSVVGAHATDNSVLTLNIAADMSFGGVLGGTGTYENNLALTKTGSAVMTLTGANTYAGPTTVGSSGGENSLGGTLQLSGSGKISTAATTVYGGTLNLNGATQTITTLALGEGASGSSATVSIGSGQLNLGGNVTYTATNDPDGAVISGTGKLTLGADRSFIVGDSANTTADLTVSAIIQNNSNVGVTTARSITKSGAGTLVFSGANNYSGNTTISAGTLSLVGSGSFNNSPVITVGTTGSEGTVLDVTAKTDGFTVLNGQTLKGIGTVNANNGGETLGTVVISGTHAPGNSVGVETIDGNVQYTGPSSIFEWELNTGAMGTRGSLAGAGGYDGVNVSGTVTGTSPTADAIFKVVLLAGSYGDGFWTTSHQWDNIFTGLGGSTPKAGWTAAFGSIAWYAGSTNVTSDTITGYFSFTPATGTATGNTLYWTAVPEPSSALAGLLLCAGLLRRRR